MKKTFLLSIAAAAIMCGTAYGFLCSNNQEQEFSDLELANIEALSDKENGVVEKCWNSITTKEGSKILYCGTCEWIDNSTDTWYSWSSECPK